MGNIVWMMSISLDGFFEGPNHELDWQLVDDELHQHFNDVLRPMAGFLDGRVTYELMASFWPTADQDPASTPVMVEFAGIWRDMPQIVYSRTLQSAGPNSTSVRDLTPEERQAQKAGMHGNMPLGGANLAATFSRLDLIDEY